MTAVHQRFPKGVPQGAAIDSRSPEMAGRDRQSPGPPEGSPLPTGPCHRAPARTACVAPPTEGEGWGVRACVTAPQRATYDESRCGHFQLLNPRRGIRSTTGRGRCTHCTHTSSLRGTRQGTNDASAQRQRRRQRAGSTRSGIVRIDASGRRSDPLERRRDRWTRAHKGQRERRGWL